MSFRHRLNRIEAATRPPQAAMESLTEAQWADRLSEWEQAGLFDAEPEFPNALEALRGALQAVSNLPPAGFALLWCETSRSIKDAWRTRQEGKVTTALVACLRIANRIAKAAA